MRGDVLLGHFPRNAWEERPRSAAELREAATHFEREAALWAAPDVKDQLTNSAAVCRRKADAM